MNALSRLALAALLTFAAACGDDSTDPVDDTTTAGDGDGDGDTTDGDGDTTGGDGDGDPGPEWQGLVFEEFITDDWEQLPGTEHYECAALTLTEDAYIAGFRALSPLGTHHTVLSLADDRTRRETDGPFDCDANDLGHNMLFASGVGTSELVFPQGVAIKVEAGQQLLLNLHLFNATDSEIEGISGTEVGLVSAAEVEQFAEVVFGGTYSIALNGQSPNEEQIVYGRCNFSQEATVITLWPHMHQLGTYMKVRHGDTMLHDTAFDFNEQVNYKIAPHVVPAGEALDVRCSYINNTGRDVFFGDSSNSEMCFVGIYRYPATDAGLFSCVAPAAPWDEDL